MGSSFGKIFKISTFGESHGPAIGVNIEGLPAGVQINLENIQFELGRRRPGQSRITTQRKEADEVEILSGVFEGVSTGTPLAMVIRNKDQKSKDYAHISHKFRPSHADYTFQGKYGIRDYRGGGRSSARETAARVAAGAVAKQFIAQAFGGHFYAYVSQVGSLKLGKDYLDLDLDQIDDHLVRCPDPEMADRMFRLIDQVRKNQDTIGGIVTGVIKNIPVGLGEPVFDKLHATLGKAMLSINAVKGFEYGSGFEGVKMTGSKHNDAFYQEGDRVRTRTNKSGGIQGGISNGEDIYFNVAFKPVATIMQDQESVDQEGNNTKISGKGRHDPCVVPRAVPIVEAMSALVIADFYLISRSNKLIH